MDQIKFVETYLQKDVYDWFEPYLREYLSGTSPDKQIDDIGLIFESYNKFIERLNQVFENPKAEKTTKQKINAL